jgi:dihydropteroate synthase
MGVLNVTPDSFSDGGTYTDPDSAAARALQLEREGATIIDVGGESTRPGSETVPTDTEIARVVPVIERIRGQSDITISIDTSKSAVAQAAINAGADIINDVTGLTGDPAMIPLAARTKVGVIIMHMQGTPRTMQIAPTYTDVVTEVREFLRQQMEAAIASGIDEMAIALDPGFGFGKTPDHNRQLLAATATLAAQPRMHSTTHQSPLTTHGRNRPPRPLLIGVSRKSYLAHLAGTKDPADRLYPGLALTSLCRERGARIFRVHDVAAHRDAARMTEAILQA